MIMERMDVKSVVAFSTTSRAHRALLQSCVVSEKISVDLETATNVSALLPRAQSLVVSCADQSIGDINSALAGFRQIRCLGLRNAPSIRGALFLGTLDHIDLSASGKIRDIGRLGGLTGLQTLDLENTKVTDIGQLSGLTGFSVIRWA